MPRTKGAFNKSTREVRAAAREYTREALETLATLMRKGETETIRMAAARELLDRGHGKPRQDIGGTLDLSLGQLIAGERP